MSFRLPAILGAALLSACDEPAPEHVEPAADPAAPAPLTDWPVTRGGPTLQGRINGPAPKDPAIDWTFTLDNPSVAEAALSEGTLIVGDLMGFIHAIDFETRKLRWKFETGDTIEGAATIHDGAVFVGSGDQSFHALELTDGSKRWSIEGLEKFPSAANVIPAPDGNGFHLILNGYDGICRCINPADGKEIWQYETNDYINGTPALIGTDRIAFGGCDSVIHVLDAATGKPVNEILTDAQITDSVASLGSTVYSGNYANQVVAAEIDAEEPTWIYQGDDFPFFSAPAVDDARVYIGCRDKALHAIDRETGKKVWVFATGGRVESSPIVFDDAVVFGSSDGRLYAVNPEDGTELWRLDLGEKLTASPIFAQDRIIIAGGAGTVFVIGSGGG
ncbi:hypothetical protein HAHE_11340 [Haloferula helveola]|uniref:Pyrrolo-quinoline quinone repeat domain-containing protein n=1 Tax=Haloferula helveola TaxID=490095 RepID=A0ABM7RC29_9BACT|nr:hypothetical protein HAHE_11340 [Haloferula helveola]